MGRDGTEDWKSREYCPATKGVFRMLLASMSEKPKLLGEAWNLGGKGPQVGA